MDVKYSRQGDALVSENEQVHEDYRVRRMEIIESKKKTDRLEIGLAKLESAMLDLADRVGILESGKES